MKRSLMKFADSIIQNKHSGKKHKGILNFRNFLLTEDEPFLPKFLPPKTKIDLPPVDTDTLDDIDDDDTNEKLPTRKLAPKLSHLISQIFVYWNEFNDFSKLKQSVRVGLQMNNSTYTEDQVLDAIDMISRTTTPINVIVPHKVRIFLVLINEHRLKMIKNNSEKNPTILNIIDDFIGKDIKMKREKINTRPTIKQIGDY